MSSSSVKGKMVGKKNIKTRRSKSDNRLLVLIGVMILCAIAYYLSDYFFVKNSNLQKNMSTDKNVTCIDMSGRSVECGDEVKKITTTTQKYVSDMAYTMRYDTAAFKVFKYKGQDYYRFLNNDSIMVIVERGIIPSSCLTSNLENNYNNCYVMLDNFTEEFYVTKTNRTYKITIKKPGFNEYTEDIKARTLYMLNSFEMKF